MKSAVYPSIFISLITTWPADDAAILVLTGSEIRTDVSGNRSAPGGLYYAFGAVDSTNLGSGAYFNGIIDEVRVYSEALTAEQIKESYLAGVMTHQNLAKE